MMDDREEEFAAPVLHGQRFRTHALPLDVLKELEGYQRLIVDVAKALYLTRRPNRQREFQAFLASNMRRSCSMRCACTKRLKLG